MFLQVGGRTDMVKRHGKWKKIVLKGLSCLIILSLFWCREISVRAEKYEYDELNRIKKVIYDDGSYVEYTYDKNGNILTTTVHENKTKNPDQQEESKESEEESKESEMPEESKGGNESGNSGGNSSPDGSKESQERDGRDPLEETKETEDSDILEESQESAESGDSGSVSNKQNIIQIIINFIKSIFIKIWEFIRNLFS